MAEILRYTFRLERLAASGRVTVEKNMRIWGIKIIYCIHFKRFNTAATGT